MCYSMQGACFIKVSTLHIFSARFKMSVGCVE